MSQTLNGKRVAVLMTDGFEEIEFTEPRSALVEAGAEVVVIAPHSGRLKAWDKDHWGGQYDVDLVLSDADPADFDALLLPGGVLNPDQLRQEQAAVDFATHFLTEGKPVAAICHGPQLLIETELLSGRTLTSYPALQTDLRNAGADWVDEEVVVDDGIVTSRKPSDIPAFNSKMIEEFSEGVHQARQLSDRAGHPVDLRH